jgi:hypothetical protein
MKRITRTIKNWLVQHGVEPEYHRDDAIYGCDPLCEELNWLVDNDKMTVEVTYYDEHFQLCAARFYWHEPGHKDGFWAVDRFNFYGWKSFDQDCLDWLADTLGQCGVPQFQQFQSPSDAALGRTMRDQRKDIVTLYVKPASTDADLKAAMITARRARDYPNVIVSCRFSGYGDDDRELWEIPEVRQLCQRLFDIGFVSDLDESTTYLCPPPKPPWGVGAGALEIWMMAKDYVDCRPVDEVLLQEFRQDLAKASEANDRTIRDINIQGGTVSVLSGIKALRSPPESD